MKSSSFVLYRLVPHNFLVCMVSQIVLVTSTRLSVFLSLFLETKLYVTEIPFLPPYLATYLPTAFSVIASGFTKWFIVSSLSVY